MKKQNKKAFTLVELLVVIAILAILATVSIVGYSAFTKKAKQSNADVEARQLYDIILANTVAPVEAEVDAIYDNNGNKQNSKSGTEKFSISFNNALVVTKTEDGGILHANTFEVFTKIVGSDALVDDAQYGLVTEELNKVGSWSFTKVLYVAANGFATEINLADGTIKSMGDNTADWSNYTVSPKA